MENNDLNGHRKRLRQRFMKTGLNGFADHEIIELILILCIPRRDVKPIAKELLKKFGSVRAFLDASREELKNVKGIGEVSITYCLLIRSLVDYCIQQKTTQQSILKDNAALVEFWQCKLGKLNHEVFEVAYLDSSYRILPDGVERLEEGIANLTQIYPQKILKSAISREASNLVLAHNHPSGIAKPSQVDLQITQNIHYAATILSIRLIDHIIITRDGFYSFRQSGLLA